MILTRVFAVEANSLLNDVAAILDDGTGYGPAGVDARIIVGLNDEPEILLVDEVLSHQPVRARVRQLKGVDLEPEVLLYGKNWHDVL